MYNNDLLVKLIGNKYVTSIYSAPLVLLEKAKYKHHSLKKFRPLSVTYFNFGAILEILILPHKRGFILSTSDAA
jgi:hypothetical protein